MQDIRAKVLEELAPNMNIEQLKMVELAVSKALIGYKVEPMETLPSTSVTTFPYLKEFLIRKKMKGLSEGTLYGYEKFLTVFLYWCNGRDLNEFKDTDALVFLAWYEQTHKISKRTLNNKRVILYTFFTFLHDTGKIAKNPMVTVDKIKYLEEIRSPLNDEELERIRMTPMNDREQALIEFLYATGCRISEVSKVKVSDIDFDRRTLVVTGKGNKQRRVYLNARAKICVMKYIENRGFEAEGLFVSDRSPHRNLSKGSLEKIVREVGERSGLGIRIFPHLFRHTFATDMYDKTENLADVQKLLGHESANTTMIYAKISQTRLQETYRRVMR